jgi:small neutral amino acid transporter SnatA (MarC family)
MLTYQLLLLVKFIGVVVYGGGLVAAFLSTSLPERKRAVHRVASPALLVIWVAGFFLTLELGVSLLELWIIGGLVLSFVSQGALVRSVTRDTRSVSAFLFAACPLVLVLALMVFRPTWEIFR